MIREALISIPLAIVATTLPSAVASAQDASPIVDPHIDGEWTGTGYTCNGKEQPPEAIIITQKGDSVEAIKVAGDDCVEAGETTWRATFRNGVFANVQMQVVAGPKTKRFVDGAARLDNSSGELRILVGGSSIDNVTFTRSRRPRSIS